MKKQNKEEEVYVDMIAKAQNIIAKVLAQGHATTAPDPATTRAPRSLVTIAEAQAPLQSAATIAEAQVQLSVPDTIASVQIVHRAQQRKLPDMIVRVLSEMIREPLAEARAL